MPEAKGKDLSFGAFPALVANAKRKWQAWGRNACTATRARSVIGIPCQCARVVLENPLNRSLSLSLTPSSLALCHGGRVRRPGTCVQDDLLSRSCSRPHCNDTTSLALGRQFAYTILQEAFSAFKEFRFERGNSIEYVKFKKVIFKK